MATVFAKTFTVHWVFCQPKTRRKPLSESRCPLPQALLNSSIKSSKRASNSIVITFAYIQHGSITARKVLRIIQHFQCKSKARLVEERGGIMHKPHSSFGREIPI